MGNNDIRQKYDLFTELLRTGFKLRYNDSVLGILWVVIKPLMNFAVLYVVFSNLKPLDAVNFEIYLFSGMVVYSYFSESVLSGAGSLQGMAHIILKVRFPKQVALLSTQGLAVISLFINLMILSVFVYFSDVNFDIIDLLYILFIFGVITFISYSISLFTSVLTVRLKDLRNILEIFLQIGFYMSPIFYPLSIIPVRFLPIIEYNPMTIMIEAIRKALIDGHVTKFNEIIIILALAMIVALIGRVVFNRSVKKIAEYY